MGALRPGGGGGGASLSDATPQPTGTAAAGVSTSAARADHVHAASGGISTGTYAARPASPTVGDRYLVTSGVRKGSLYQCLVATVWTLADIVLPAELQPSLVGYFDGEDLLGPGLGRWRNRAPAQLGNDLVTFSSSTMPTVGTASLSAGLGYAQTGGGARMETYAPFPTGAGGRTVAVLASNVTPNTGVAQNHLLHWGRNGAANQTYGIACCVGSVGQWGNHYWSSTYASGTSATEAGAARIVARYNGTADRFFRNGVALGSANTKTLAAPTDYAQLAMFSIAGASTEFAPSGTRIHAAAAWTTGLSDASVAILDAWLAERHGS